MSGSSYLIASVAVGVTVNRVKPTPVGINDNRALHLSATASSGALLPSQRGMGLRFQRASLLGTSCRRQGGEEECALIHCLQSRRVGLQCCVVSLSDLQLMNIKKPGAGIDLYMSFSRSHLFWAIAIQGAITVLLDILTGAADRETVTKLEWIESSKSSFQVPNHILGDLQCHTTLIEFRVDSAPE